MEFCSKQWTMRISGSEKSILMPAMMGQFGSSIDCNVRLVLLFGIIFLTQTIIYSCAGNCFCAVFNCFENESEWRKFQQQRTPIQNNFTQASCPPRPFCLTNTSRKQKWRTVDSTQQLSKHMIGSVWQTGWMDIFSQSIIEWLRVSARGQGGF